MNSSTNDGRELLGVAPIMVGLLIFTCRTSPGIQSSMSILERLSGTALNGNAGFAPGEVSTVAPLSAGLARSPISTGELRGTEAMPFLTKNTFNGSAYAPAMLTFWAL